MVKLHTEQAVLRPVLYEEKEKGYHVNPECAVVSANDTKTSLLFRGWGWGWGWGRGIILQR